MSSEEDRFKHSVRRRNKVRKDIFSNDLKGAFKIKVLDARKPEYERKKVRVTEITESEDDYETEDF